MQYLPRVLDDELDALLRHAPAIAIDGPKGVGKTETARRHAHHVWHLDDEAQRDILAADPRAADDQPGTVLFDEWQRFPPIWDAVRRAVDGHASPGRFLLTGSATPVAGADTHSGAGRIVSLRMRPMAIHERGRAHPTVSLTSLLQGSAAIAGSSEFTLSDYLKEVTASGFPGIHPLSEPLRTAQLNGYLHRIVDRDLREQGLAVRRPETLRRWLAAYAAASASSTTYSKLLDATTAGDGSQPAKTTTITYRDHLTQLWLLDPLPGWSPARSPFARLQQAPKHHLADPGLAARLLNLSSRSLSRPTGAAMAGPLFESLVTLSVRVAAQPLGARVGHLRTSNGDHEVDLIVEGIDGEVVGIEVKLAPAVTDADVRHLHWLRARSPDVVDLMVVTTGSRAYRRRDGVAVVPLALFGP